MTYHVTRGPTRPAAPITFIVLDDEGRVAIGPLDFSQTSGLIVNLLEAMTVAVMPPGDEVLRHCIDLGIAAARNGAGQEAGRDG
jgi:hypothetical protein